jgi:hypothetical protein
MTFRWLGQQPCPSGQYWDGTACRSGVIKICASGFELVAGECVASIRGALPGPIAPPTGSVTLRQGDYYRSRWLIGLNPTASSCEAVRDALNSAIGQAEQGADWPWGRPQSTFAGVLRVALDPVSNSIFTGVGPWPSSRIGEPYATQGTCLLYAQGQWSAADQAVDVAQFAASLAPNTRLLDFWDHTSDPQAASPLIDVTGAGCGAEAVMRFDPATGAFACVSTRPECPIGQYWDGTTCQTIPVPTTCPTGKVPIFDVDRNGYTCCDIGQVLSPAGLCVAPSALPPVTSPAPAAAPAVKKSNVPLYVALGALVLGALYVGARGAS